MHKRFIMVLVIGFLIGAGPASTAFAKNDTVPGTQCPKVKYYIGHLYLFEKDPLTWERVPEGAWGKMLYKLWYDKFYFVFNGHGLAPNETYMLIYYPDPWPGNGLIPLGIGIANVGGNLNISGKLADVCDLPADYDENFGYGAKIWLVLASDVDLTGERPKMIGWSPEEYLFEYNLITFDNTTCGYEILPDVEEETSDNGS